MAEMAALRQEAPLNAAKVVYSPGFSVVQKAIERVRIVPFLKALAQGQAVDGVDFAQFRTVWANKDDSKWIEEQFRAAPVATNLHEWIPSNKLPDVIARAGTYAEKLKWIDLQE